MRKYLLFPIVLLVSFSCLGQDFSNKGKDFWVGYGYHQQMTNGGGGGSQDMVLYFATDQVTHIVITIPATGYVQNITTAAGNNVTTSATIPKTGVNDARLTAEGLFNKGIHITSDEPMVAYAHIYNQSVSGATILFPTNTLGRNYFSVNYKNWSNSANSNCWFYVVAADTGTTTVQITPTGNTTGGWVAGNTYTVTLTQGQIYNVMGALISSPANCNPVCTGVDLTGSTINSVNTGTGCKKIAVFSGSGRISITCNNSNSSSDNYMVQAMPQTAWGKKYLTVPANGNQAYNIYRVCVSNPAAVVKINGAVTALPLQNNFYYEIAATNQPQKIEADSAIMVAQYFTSQGACGNGTPGDPEVIYLSAVEQNINTVLWNATPNYQITVHDFNVVLPNSGTAVSSFRLDGAPVTGWVVHPQDANYVYLKKQVSVGFHIITSDSGFNAIAYGFGNAESYGFNAGTNIKDLYQQIGVNTQYGIETTPSVCTNSPFKFKVSLPYIPDSMYWNFHNAAGMMPNNTNVFVNNVGNVAQDSTTTVNGKLIHWYSLPLFYNFSAVGVYPITITTYVPNADCGSVQDIDFNLTVTSPPVADFAWVASGCVADSVRFMETTPQLPKPTYHFWWDFGDPGSGANNTSGLRNPTHLFSAPGTYTVRFSDITTPGCLSDTIVHQVIVNPLPTATISGTASVCLNDPSPLITFTGSGGTAPYIFTYNINGGAPINIQSTGNTATVFAPTNVAGVFTYTLMNVRDTGTTQCTQNINAQVAVITVNANHSIVLTSGAATTNQTVCINTAITPITYTLGGGATGATITGLPPGVTYSVTGFTLTISGSPTSAAGSPYNYTITTTGNTCLPTTATGTITVSPDHTITLTSAPATANQTVCINTPITPITYTLGGGATGATVTGLPAGVTSSVAGTTLTISGSPTTTTGSPFTYNITTTGNNCVVATASGTITVLPVHTITLTSAPATANQTVCINTPITPIVYTLGGGATGATVTGLPAGVTFVVAGTTLTISGTPTTTVGSPFTYTITTTGNACLTASATGTITVSPDHTITLTSAPATANQTVCINTPITPITYTLGGGATGATVTGLPAGVTSSVAGTTLTISGSPTTTTGSPFTYNITTTGNNCVVATASGTITVLPVHTITLTSAPATANQTVCINTPITPIVYTLGGGATGATVTGLPAGVTFVVAGTSLTISGTPTTTVGSPFTYTITTTGNACLTASATGTITVNPNHTITLTSAPATANQTVCINTPITPITYTLGGGATGATVTGLPAGVTSSVAGTTLTISGSPTTTTGSPFTYNITTTGNNCVVATASGTITVLPVHTITLTSAPATANQTVCINTPITPIVYTLGGGATGATVTGLPAGVTFVVAGTTLTISGTPTTTVGSPFTYTITTTGNACLTASATGTITVSPDHTITLTSAPATTSQTVCINLPIINITYTIGGGATGVTVTGLPAGVTSSLVGTTLTISGSPSTTAGSPFNYHITTTGNNCVVATANGTITVNPLPTANFTFTAPSCETRVISFTDASVANVGTINSWSWNFGDPGSGAANTSTLQNPVHTFATAGSYIVTLVVTSTTGCISSVHQSTVVINVRPQAGYIIPQVCLSDTYAQFTDTSHIASGTIVGWNWNFGDPGSGVNNTSTLQNPQHSYSAVGPYTVTLVVTSNLGCRDTIVHILVVNGSFPIANFTVNNPATLCANDSVSIVNTSTVFPGVITRVEIYWDNVGFPAVFDVDLNPFPGKVYKHLYPNFQAPLTKVFTIKFRAYSGGVCLNDKLGNITVNAAPKVQFNAMPDTCLLAAPFQITEASETGGVPGTGVFTGPGISPTGIFSPAVAGIGTHTILYTFTSTAAGCVDTMSRTITVLDTAHAVFTWVTPICDGVPGSFTDQSTAPATVTLGNTVWNFGDGSPVQNHAPGSTFPHLFPGPGTYTVTMYNVSAYGCNSTICSRTVTVDPNHTIVLTSGAGTNNQTVCINVPVIPIVYTLGGGASGAIVTGLPAGVTSSQAGNILTISGAPTSTAGSPFNYSIVTTGNSCTTATATGTLSVSSNHTLTLTSGAPTTDQRVCLNTPIASVIYTLGGGATGVIITGLPPGVTSSVVGNTLTISGTPSSTAGTPYNYSIVTTGNNCVTASATGVIKVSPYPRPSFAFDKPSYCIPNATVTFNNTSSIEDGTENQFTYSWDFGDPASGSNTSVAKSPSHYYTGTGPFSIILTVTSGFGCSHDTTIVLNAIHPQPKAKFDISKPSICIGDMVTFTDQSDGVDAAINKWTWDFGDGQQAFSSPVSHLYQATDTFTVGLFVSNLNGCNSDTLKKPFAVYPYPTVDAGPDLFVLENGSVVLKSVVTGNDLQYLWTPNIYMNNNTLPQPLVTNPLTDVTYKLTVTARGGCQLSDVMFLKLLKGPRIPNTFTPNNDGINDKWVIEYLDTYPNNRVQVFTRTGQLVFESHGYSIPWDGTYKGKPLPFDTYYYIIEPNNGRAPITGYVTIVK